MLTSNVLTEKLATILMFCGQNDVQLSIKTKGNINKVEIITEPIKEFIITIVDDKDETLFKLICDKFEELKQLFK